MAEYTATSIKVVISKVIRDLGNKLPGHLIEPMLEWIPEGIDQMETPFSLIKCSTPSYGESGEYVTKNHVVKLPCGLVGVLAVEDMYGNRVHRSGQQTNIRSTTALGGNADLNPARTTDFETYVDGVLNPVPWDGSNIAAMNSGEVPAAYDIKFNYLQTSEESMFVKIHYEALPIDKEGYPLILDEVNYREALYWWVMGKLIGQGFKHPIIPASLQGMQYCIDHFEKYAGRALGKIKMPDQDRMAKLNYATTRLIPPTQFYDDFFIGSSQRENIGLM